MKSQSGSAQRSALRAARQPASDLQTPQPLSGSHQNTAKHGWPVAVVLLGLLCSVAWMGFLAWGVIWLLFIHHF